MKKNTYLLNTMLAVVLGVTLLVAVLVRTFAPIIIIPALNIPNMVLISLAALLLDHYLAPGAPRCYRCIPILAAITFGLLPWCACFVDLSRAFELAGRGCVVFTTVTYLFTDMQDRLSSGPHSKAAPIISAFGLYLACQCFM